MNEAKIDYLFFEYIFGGRFNHLQKIIYMLDGRDLDQSLLLFRQSAKGSIAKDECLDTSP